MPFDPNYPFDPTDPSQWWQLRNLPRTLVQPNAPPPNGASGNAAESDGIDDWFAPEDDGFPNDWVSPDNNNAPAPAAAPRTAPTAPSPPSNAASPATSNRRAARFDPYEAFWSQIPASRAGAFAWAPPIFLSPDSFSPQNIPSSAWGTPPTFSNPLAQFLPATNALPSLPLDFGTGGILGGIGRMIAEQAKANDPQEVAKNGILGDIAKLSAASGAINATNPWDAPRAACSARLRNHQPPPRKRPFHQSTPHRAFLRPCPPRIPICFQAVPGSVTSTLRSRFRETWPVRLCRAPPPAQVIH
jgi:hypothetical protein